MDLGEVEQPDHFLFFRPGEVTLLLEPAGDATRLSAAGWQRLRAILNEKAGRELVDNEPIESHPAVRINRPQGVFGIQSADLYTFRLKSWQGDLGSETEEALEAIRTAVTDVKTAVEILNGSKEEFDPEELNKADKDLAADRDLGSHWLIAASPNWIARGLDVPDCPCPGGRPKKATAKKTFDPDDVQKILEEMNGSLPTSTAGQATSPLRGQNVRVAVFDTWPGNRIQQRINDIQGRNPTRDLAGLEKANRADFATRWDKVHPVWGATYSTRVDCQGEIDGPYELPDHGLFCAHIVKEIAPEVDLHVYRCLDDWGAYDLHYLAETVQEAIQKAETDDIPLVLNLSLGFGPHPSVVNRVLANPLMSRANFAGLAKTEMRKERTNDVRRADGNVLKSKVMLATTYLFSLSGEAKVLAVAAAGNDACAPNEDANNLPSDASGRPSPRFPALVEGVLGVSSIQGDSRYSSFSNFDDLPGTPDDGISAFGGEVDDPDPGAPVTSEGIVGPYSYDHIEEPGAVTRNDYGLAEWAGTSFATPIAAALAACLWSYNPAALNARDVLDAIVKKPDNSSRRFIPLFQK